jgi:acyl carrier protein
MQATNDARTALRKLILEDYLFTEDESALTDDMSFLNEGILDSMGILEIIMFLEEQFQITVAEDEMIPDNLDSIDNLFVYIGRKQETA